MKLHHLRDLLAVAEHGSLRAAARAIGIAQPAITRSIQELERELGASLFERRARGIMPTAIGAAFIRRARSIDNELLRARDEVAQLRGQMHGSVRVAMSMVPHMALLPGVLRPFRQRFPEVRLDIVDAVFPTVAAGVQDGTVDCYVGPPPEQLPEGLLMEKLFDNTRVIVGRKGHPLRSAAELRELVGAEWVTTSITTHAEHELGPLFAQHGLPPPTLVMQVHSALTLIVSLLYTDLLTMLPRQWMTFPLTKDALQVIEVAETLAAPPICIIQRAGLPLTPATEFFCDLVRREAAHAAAG